jgi:S-adenosylmethionine:tRNA ribosyltransferase-isomerase
VLLKPADLKVSQRIIFNQCRLEAEVIAKGIIRFNSKDADFIYSKGMMPLPPYIKRPPDEQDNLYYQTVFARRPGAVASPTAGLHFSEALLSCIKNKGVALAYLTLEINYATFNPVKTENILKHKMYSEYFEISESLLSLVRKIKLTGKRVVAVGTTSCRALETVAGLFNDSLVCLHGYKGWTELFIYPGYQFKIIDSLLTNFHLPRTTLFILVCAFAGKDLIMQAYKEAIACGYRFYSYGDAMLII